MEEASIVIVGKKGDDVKAGPLADKAIARKPQRITGLLRNINFIDGAMTKIEHPRSSREW